MPSFSNRKKLAFGNFLSLSISLIVAGCFNEPDFATIPQIEFKELRRYPIAAGTGVGQQRRDSVVISVNFKDGDGDLGDNLPLDSAVVDNYLRNGGWGNCKIRTFRLENNRYVERPLNENNFLTFPRLSKEGQRGPIEGTLDFKSIYFTEEDTKSYLTKFRVQLRDRALHVSNEVETDTITLPWPNK